MSYQKQTFVAYMHDVKGNGNPGAYCNGLDNIEKLLSVDIDVEFTKDECAELYNILQDLRKAPERIGKNEHTVRQYASQLNQYIKFRQWQTINPVAERKSVEIVERPSLTEIAGWMPFYTELADKLLAYKDDRNKLLELLHKLFKDIGMKSPFMEKDTPMSDVDPFTIFGCFNKGITDANRIKILQGFKKEFSVSADAPSNFDGVPVLNNMMAVFFAFQNDPRRGPKDIDNLWDLCKVAVDYADTPTEETKDNFVRAFDLVKEQFGIRWNITMGLFWLRPYHYINLDDKNRKYLAMGKAIPPVDMMIASKLKNVPSGTEYLGIIEDCKKAFLHSYADSKNFVDLSQQAWIATTGNQSEETNTNTSDIEKDPLTLSKETWIEILKDSTITTWETLAILRKIWDYGGEITYYKLAKIYGKTHAYYSQWINGFHKRIVRQYQLPDYPGENPYPTVGWHAPIGFIGRDVLEDGQMHHLLILRNELKEALMSDTITNIHSETDVGLNTILYGPPGTGKTYHTVIYAVAIVENRELASVAEEDYSAVLTRYKEYKAQGRIDFTTFHQSYGYEEFIEGIRPAIIDDGDESDSGNIQYSVQPGVFKRFCEKAERPAVVQSSIGNLGINENATIWKVSLWSTGDNEVRTECLKNGHIRIGWDQYGKDITDETDFSVDGGRVVLNAFMNKMQVGDIVLSCYSASTIDAIGVVTGEYEWHDEYHELKRLRKVNWIVKNIRENIMAINSGTVMTLASVYRLSNIAISDVYKLIEKHKPTTLIPVAQKENYVFIIDEINRGNISKIFGELITLIEETKRVGKEEETTAVLPYSQKIFGVPKNVYIIGTMNTADRSIATIDTALRRRFFFKEMMPQPDVLAGVNVEGVAVSDMLMRMNKRIAVLYDREHTIGHAYFMPLKENSTIETLAKIFINNIIPLLQEYFYEDYEKIQLVLGDNRKQSDEYKFIIDKENDYTDLFGDVDVGLDDGRNYEINYSAFNRIEAYKSI